MRRPRFIVATLLGLAAVVLAIGPAWAAAELVARRFALAPTPVTAFLSGLAAVALVSPWIDRGSIPAVISHEAGHATAALLTRARLTEFYATAGRGGHVRYQGGIPTVIGLAPYVLPLPALALVGIQAVIGGGPAPYMAGAIGAALGFHVVLACTDFHAYLRSGDVGPVSDLRHLGPLGTGLWMLALNVALGATLLAFAADGAGAVPAFWSRAAALDLVVVRSGIEIVGDGSARAVGLAETAWQAIR